MSEPDITALRYGDLVGTVEIDGHAESPLNSLVALVNMPPKFRPIAVEIRLFGSFDDTVSFAILAYDSEIVGKGLEAAMSYARVHGRLPVRRFSGSVHSTTVHRYFRQCTIAAVDSGAIALRNLFEIEDATASSGGNSISTELEHQI